MDKPQILRAGTEVDKYVLEHCLGVGGFSIVYLGRRKDEQTAERVIIKEYMPNKMAMRMENGDVVPKEAASSELFKHCRKAFFKEATTLATLKHPNIVNVIGFFRENETVYMVMEYHDGKNLEAYIRKRSGGMSEKFIRTIFPPLLEGLRMVHSKGLLHLDIKPANIHIRPGGSPYLFDFGAVHQVANSRQFQLRQVVTPGFSPPEQHQRGGYVGPWTDLYAIGATMRSCIDGRSPPSALLRIENDTLKPAQALFKRRYSPALLEAIDWAMELDPLLRPQSVEELARALQADYEEPKQERAFFGKLTNALLGGRR